MKQKIRRTFGEKNIQKYDSFDYFMQSRESNIQLVKSLTFWCDSFKDDSLLPYNTLQDVPEEYLLWEKLYLRFLWLYHLNILLKSTGTCISWHWITIIVGYFQWFFVFVLFCFVLFCFVFVIVLVQYQICFKYHTIYVFHYVA